MDPKVFLSILAMDSYNRGYGAGLRGLPVAANVTRLGNATIRTDSTIELGSAAQSAGFYAIAYDWTHDGKTERVVMYRGSDTFLTPDETNGGPDTYNGWGVGMGSPYGPQARMAMQFYNAATGRDPTIMENGFANVIVSGHSLGGGLAGLVGSLTGSQIVLFDPMPFDLAVHTAFNDASNQYTYTGANGVLYTNLTQEQHDFLTLVYGGQRTDGYLPWLPSEEGVTGAFIPFAPDHANTNRLDYFRSVFSQAATAGLQRLDLPTDTPLDSSERNMVGQRHDGSLIVMRVFAETLGANQQHWTASARYFMPALFDEQLGAATGASEFDATNADASGAMRAAIAYSAIDVGVRPFGDTGIQALFDDANDFGLALPNLPGVVSTQVRTAIGQLIVEFAGLLAVNRIESAHWNQAVRGTVNIGVNQSNGSPDNSFQIDLTDRTWSFGGDRQVPFEPVSAFDIIDGLIKAAAAPDVVAAVGRWLSSRSGGAYPTVFDAVDSIAISLRDGQLFNTANSTRYQMVVGRDAADAFTIGGNAAIVLAGNGVNTIVGTAGNDALIGGNGNDTFVGGAGNDWLYGGDGSNILMGSNSNGSDLNDNDTVYYARRTGAFFVSYAGMSRNDPVLVARTGGTDTLFGIEEIFLGSAQSQIRVVGRIDRDTDLVIHNGSVGRSLINPVNFGNGIAFTNIGGQGSIFDKVTHGTILGCVDKRDSHLPRVLIQDCFLRSSHGSWGLVGCGMGVDRAAATA